MGEIKGKTDKARIDKVVRTPRALAGRLKNKGDQFVHHTFGKVWQECESMAGGVATWQAIVMAKKQTVAKEIVACQFFGVAMFGNEPNTH
jgi:hypothetical protein